MIVIVSPPPAELPPPWTTVRPPWTATLPSVPSALWSAPGTSVPAIVRLSFPLPSRTSRTSIVLVEPSVANAFRSR